MRIRRKRLPAAIGRFLLCKRRKEKSRASLEKYKYFTKYCRKHNFEDTYKYCLENGAEEYTLKSMAKDNYINLLDNELLRVKGIFNGLFGQEYQNIYHHKLDFTDDFEIIDTEKYELIQKLNNDYIEKVKKCNTHYTVGAYIAAWSRFELACMIWHGINAGGTIYYFHTDSLKIGNVSDDLFNNWLETQYSKYFKQKFQLTRLMRRLVANSEPLHVPASCFG